MEQRLLAPAKWLRPALETVDGQDRTSVVLMFVLTWPFYSALGLFVGYGPAVASLIMTSLISIGIEFVAACAVVVVAGPARLSRASPIQVAG